MKFQSLKMDQILRVKKVATFLQSQLHIIMIILLYYYAVLVPVPIYPIGLRPFTVSNCNLMSLS